MTAVHIKIHDLRVWAIPLRKPFQHLQRTTNFLTKSTKAQKNKQLNKHRSGRRDEMNEQQKMNKIPGRASDFRLKLNGNLRVARLPHTSDGLASKQTLLLFGFGLHILSRA